MRLLASAIDNTTRFIGRAVAWLALIMVIVQFGVVVARYVFGVGSLHAQEAVVYLHAVIFMLAAAYTLSDDGHVRVDIIYRSASLRYKAWVDLLGAVALLIPVAIIITVASWGYVANSWRIMESSMEVSGIPGVFLLKTLIPVFAILMGAQGLVMALRALHTIFSPALADAAGAFLLVAPLGGITVWATLGAGQEALWRLSDRVMNVGNAPPVSGGEWIARITADSLTVFFPVVGALLVVVALAYGVTAASRLFEGGDRA